MSLYSLETELSSIITVGSDSIRVESKRLTIQIPFGGFVFQTPTAVVNLKTDERIPIQDVTRIASLSIWGIGVMMSLLFWIKCRKRK